jgi:hypothetical protein
MPRFYLHVHDSAYAIDEEGYDLPDLRAAFVEAAKGLRDIISHQVRNGRLLPQSHVRITNQRGEHLGLVTFMDAIDVLPHVEAHG